MAGASWRDLPGIPGQYTCMYGFLKTVLNLGQNFFACLPAVAAKEAFAVLEKPGGGGGRFRQAQASPQALSPGC